MPKFSIDYSNLENTVYKKAYKLKDVENRIEKVAFDIVKFKDDDQGANLWQIQSADDGEYIIAMYAQDEEKTAATWEVFLNKSAQTLQISYKGDPLFNVATSKLGIPSSEFHKVAQYLPNKLSGNKKMVHALLNELPASSKKEVLSKYPELV